MATHTPRGTINVDQFNGGSPAQAMRAAAIWMEEFEHNIWTVTVEERRADWLVLVYWHPVEEEDGADG